jgi:hypothetical protein
MQKIKVQYFKNRKEYRKLDETLLPFIQIQQSTQQIKNMGSAAHYAKNIVY